MPKDYKNINKNNSKKTRSFTGILPFFTGLSIGLFVAFIVYLNGSLNSRVVESPEITVDDIGEDSQVAEQESGVEENVVEPQFDFYTILPQMEVSVSEWVATDDSEPDPVPVEDGVYILQVGSFKDYSSADEVKANLALMGISADIQRVVINGRDIRHRVRIGPYKDSQKLKSARDLLIENNLDFMLLKLEVDNT